MIRVVLLLAAVSLCTFCTEGRPPVSAPVKRSADTAPAVEPRTAATQAPGSTAPSAQRAIVDPDSGELIPHSPDPAQAERHARQPVPLAAPTATPTEPLIEKPSPVPGGGMMIDLQGRFQHSISATSDADRADTSEHPAPSPATEAHHE